MSTGNRTKINDKNLQMKISIQIYWLSCIHSLNFDIIQDGVVTISWERYGSNSEENQTESWGSGKAIK